MKIRVALIQTNSQRSFEANESTVSDAIHAAAAQGAELILTPENVMMMETNKETALATSQPEASHPALPFFSQLAIKTGATILVGSLAVKISETQLANRCYLFEGGSGRILAQYDKIHLFDITLSNGEIYRESALYRGGNEAVLVNLAIKSQSQSQSPIDSVEKPSETRSVKIGLTICYDLRFPHLFAQLAQAGAEIITVPAAFTATTGRAHWHSLLRARAIENGCFILAPAQCGLYAEGRETYGHSLIISPWGEVIADGGSEIGTIMADIDLAEVVKTRAQIPSLTHCRPFTLKVI